MSIYYPGCADNIAPPVCSDCPDKELAGIRSIFFEKVSHVFTDITDPTEWETAICAENVYVFPYTRGSLEIAEQMSAGFGDVQEDLDAYEFTLNVFEPNFAENCDFWNTIKKSKNFKVGYRTETKVYVSENAALIVPKAPIAEDLKAKVVWNVIIKFVQEDIPCPVNMPVGVFDKCIACAP